MRWAVFVWVLGCGRGSPPTVATPEASERPDVLARSWYLKAAMSDARGDAEAAERAFRWVDRLDDGPWADVHRGQFLLRQDRADEAREAFQRALAVQPDLVDAQLGLGLSLTPSQPDQAVAVLEPLVELRPCPIATDGPDALRARAEDRCRAR